MSKPEKKLFRVDIEAEIYVMALDELDALRRAKSGMRDLNIHDVGWAHPVKPGAIIDSEQGEAQPYNSDDDRTVDEIVAAMSGTPAIKGTEANGEGAHFICPECGEEAKRTYSPSRGPYYWCIKCAVEGVLGIDLEAAEAN